jgi:hypothetical protein
MGSLAAVESSNLLILQVKRQCSSSSIKRAHMLLAHIHAQHALISAPADDRPASLTCSLSRTQPSQFTLSN